MNEIVHEQQKHLQHPQEIQKEVSEIVIPRLREDLDNAYKAIAEADIKSIEQLQNTLSTFIQKTNDIYNQVGNLRNRTYAK